MLENVEGARQWSEEAFFLLGLLTVSRWAVVAGMDELLLRDALTAPEGPTASGRDRSPR